MTTNTKTKEIVITTATIDFGDWWISATGQVDEYWDWKFEYQFKPMPISTWTERQHFSDEEEVEAFLWEEVQRINKKYSSCAFTHETEEVENEDYYEEDED